MINIGFLTTTRADFSILKPLIKIIDYDSSLDYKLIVSGTHLDPKFGETINEINNCEIKIHHKIQYEINTESTNKLIFGQSEFLKELQNAIDSVKLDCIVVVGDRYEIAFSSLLFVLNLLPIIHLHGGEVTQGANDDIFRNTITKCSLIHFASTENHRKRIVEMGENPKMVYNTGALGLHNIQNTSLFSKKEVYKKLELNTNKKCFVVTYNPETNLKENQNLKNLNNFLKSLNEFSNYNIVLTSCNADLQGIQFNEVIKNWVQHQKNTFYYNSLGSKLYHSLIKHSVCVVGNSSSGIIEAPSLMTPTLNIGNRQKGRDMGSSIFNVECNTKMITKRLKLILNTKKSEIDFLNPYENSDVTNKMFKILKSINFKNLPQKKY